MNTKLYMVQLGTHRGRLYTNSGDTRSLRVNNRALPDGTLVTIRKEYVAYRWALLNEDVHYGYPMDLLIPITKINKILGGLRDITSNAA